MSRPPGSRSLWPGRRWARVIRSSAERRHSSPATVRRRAWRRYASCLSCRPPFPIARWNAAELSHGHDLLDAARERFSQSEGAQGALAVAARTPRLDGARHRIRRDETSECDEGTERDEVRAEYRTELATRLGDDRERHDLDVRALRGAGAVVEQRQSARSQIREVARARLRRERDEDFGTYACECVAFIPARTAPSARSSAARAIPCPPEPAKRTARSISGPPRATRRCAGVPCPQSRGRRRRTASV